MSTGLEVLLKGYWSLPPQLVLKFPAQTVAV